MFGIPPIVIAVVAILVVFVLVAILYTKNYIKVPPNQVAVFTGRRAKGKDEQDKKTTYVRGGARFKMPVIEQVDIMDLEPFSVPASVDNVYSKDGVPVNVNAMGLIRFGSDDQAIATAVQRFLTTDRRTLHTQVQEILAGNMRGIVAQMTVEELNGNRDQFTARVVEEAGSAFARIGMELDVLTIQNISDANGYLDALGRGRIAEVKRDAKIREAEAERDAQIASAEAKRQGDTAQAEADTAIAQANKNRDLELARIDATVGAEKARATQAGPQAQAEARRAVLVAEAAAQQAQTEAMIAVEKLRAERAREAQQADVVVPAEAAKQAAILEAEGRRQADIARAEAQAEARRLEGSAEAEARTVTAAARRAELEAEAEGDKAKLLAQAEGQQAMAAALNAFNDESARLSVLPALIEQLPRVAEAVALPLGQISNMVVLDGGNGKGSDAIGSLVPRALVQAIAAIQAMGIDVSQLIGGNGGKTDSDKSHTTGGAAASSASSS